MPGKEGRIAGGILAGGAGLRIGGVPKARIRLDGVPLLARIAGQLAALFGEVVVVTGEGELPPALLRDLPPGTLFARDRPPGRGPLAGIEAGLTRTSREALFVVACDMPFLDPPLMGRMAGGFLESGCDVLLPRIGAHDEPLHALYRTRLAAPMRLHLAGGADPAVRAFFARCRTCYLDLADTPAQRRAFFNLNTPEDLELLRAEGRSVEVGTDG